ncbi:MAG: NADH-quinone oxidoreductase subunit NuoG [Gammaproteobacteria bacterium]
MSDDMIKVEVNGRELAARKGEMLIQVTDREGITVPRFCYHEKLSVAANCRMCLVEVEKAPKALPACATPVMDGMKAFTRSPKALAAQKAVMEFLLINHPLDCPICDQGGECELQDVALGFGSAVSQYEESKRIIKDENIGPLISTEMTRCIHCTRCVRFGTEIEGIQELGATGRGEFMVIGTYVGQTIDHELSGNIIDLCPVGALTSKPFRFQARAWELNQIETIAPHDGIGSNLYGHLSRGELLRVVPRTNELVNETWISDRDRFSYEGVYAPDRLQRPEVKNGAGAWTAVDWAVALETAVKQLRDATGGDFDELGVLVSSNATNEELFLVGEIARKLGCGNVDHRLRQADFSAGIVEPTLGQTVAELEQNDAVLVVGANLRKDVPLAAHRLRKAAMRGARIGFVNSRRFEVLHPVTGQVIVKPSEMAGALASKEVAEMLKGEGRKTILLGRLALANPDYAALRRAADALAKATGATVATLADGANAMGAYSVGAVPAGGGLNAREMVERPRKAYVLLGIEPELDALDGAGLSAALKSAGAVVVLNPYATDAMREYASALLPVGTWAESAGTFVNAGGLWQAWNGVVPPVAQSRPAWKVLRVLGNLFGLEGFEYEDIEEVREAVRAFVESQREGANHSRRKGAAPTGAKVVGAAPSRRENELEAVPGFATYGGDMIVRRAGALQQTRDAQADQFVRLHPDTASSLSLKHGDAVFVRAGDGRAVFTLHIDDGMAPDAVWLPLGTRIATRLGLAAGTVTVEAASQ